MKAIRIAAILTFSLFSLAASLHAQAAPPPVGSWTGHPNGVENHPVNLSISPDGVCTYSEPGVFLRGECGWQPTASNGGILTICYVTPTVTQVFHNKLYLGVTWMSRNQIFVRAGMGPQEAGILRRM